MFCSIFETKTGKETKKQNLFTTVPLQKLNNIYANANMSLGFRIFSLTHWLLWSILAVITSPAHKLQASSPWKEKYYADFSDFCG